MHTRPTVSVVIPAYNEERRLEPTLEKVDAFFSARPGGYEIIVVDDGSRDRTAACAAEFKPRQGRVRLLHNRRNRGKGASVRRGAAAARGETILFTDADLSTPIEDYPRLAAAAARGADAAIGSRAVRGANVAEPQPLYRTLMGKFFNLLVQLVLLPGLHDTQCGFKLFRRGAARRIFARQTIPGFGFDVEILYIARRLGLRIAEVPVEWRNSPASKVSPVRDSAQMFLDLFRTRWRHRFLRSEHRSK